MVLEEPGNELHKRLAMVVVESKSGKLHGLDKREWRNAETSESDAMLGVS